MVPSMQIRIPDEAKKSLVDFANLSNEEANELISVIRSTPLVLQRKRFISRVASNISLQVNVRDILQLIIALYTVRNQAGFSIQEFAELLTDRIVSDLQEEVVAPKKDEIKARLAMFLSQDQTLGVISKALELKTEHEHVYHLGRIITDLRPIFGDKPEDPPHAGVIIHQLKIEYHAHDDQIHEFFVALDSEDVQKLLEQLQRAQAKEKGLKTFLDSTSLQIMGEGD